MYPKTSNNSPARKRVDNLTNGDGPYSPHPSRRPLPSISARAVRSYSLKQTSAPCRLNSTLTRIYYKYKVQYPSTGCPVHSHHRDLRRWVERTVTLRNPKLDTVRIIVSGAYLTFGSVSPPASHFSLHIHFFPPLLRFSSGCPFSNDPDIPLTHPEGARLSRIALGQSE